MPTAVFPTTGIAVLSAVLMDQKAFGPEFVPGDRGRGGVVGPLHPQALPHKLCFWAFLTKNTLVPSLSRRWWLLPRPSRCSGGSNVFVRCF